MKRLDATFESCSDLQELFQPLSPDLVALQLSSGPLNGRKQAWGFDGFRLNLLKTNQTLFLSGSRRPAACKLAMTRSMAAERRFTDRGLRQRSTPRTLRP